MKRDYRFFNLYNLIAIIFFISTLFVMNACRKNNNANISKTTISSFLQKDVVTVANAHKQLTQVVTIASIRQLSDGNTQVLFHQNEEIFNVADPNIIAKLYLAMQAGSFVKITYNPWQALLLQVEYLTNQELHENNQRKAERGLNMMQGNAIKLTANNLVNEDFNNVEALGIMNITTPSLIPIIPDFTTAQMMFNYLTKQCCALGGPYAIDYCISFQYCEDGCYARAHKMCYIINNKYNYSTHKVFSFANVSGHSLSVKGEKWGGCCINWWYHVAPLVTINTPTGPKAFVFDPAMFDQPVLLTTWLHAQTNPSCSGSAYVDMINIQPTTSYEPADYTGYTFDTDPYFAGTDTTMVNYSSLKTCP